jgi:hypothetical protein
MREVEDLWFGGNGEDSMAQAKRLHQRLDNALSLISGLQQPSREMEDDEDHMADMQQEVNDIAEDLYCALTGNEVLPL